MGLVPQVILILLFLKEKISTPRLISKYYTDRTSNRINKTYNMTIPYDWSDTAKRFENRLSQKRKACKNYKFQKILKPNLYYILDIPRRYLMCAPFKAGSSSWHKTFWAMRRQRANLSMDSQYFTHGDWQGNQGSSFHLSDGNRINIIKSVHGDDNFNENPPNGSSFRLILTRHPFARFISGWHQKFHNTDNYYWRQLYKKFRNLKLYTKKLDKTHVMAFEDFATYAADNPKVMKTLDGHFIPISTLCKPCSLDFVYILKAESADVDEPWLKRRLGMEDINVLRHGIGPGGSVINENPRTNIKKYISTLRPNVIAKLYEIYEQDFTIFGYTFNFTTLEAGGFE
uniref:uncharacterized protein LOC120328736 n=1 Tax=Styela clava TaxID=7725 RepID=UPI00193A8AD4|nr:uncharacterized protein LOC120328736 [Styela clava]